jgi:class 3 adenylate cyclase
MFWALIPVSTIVIVGVAVLNNGALDPRLVFTRITLWSVMGLIVTLAFIGLERFAAIQVVHWFALPPDTGAVAAGAVIAGTFVPIRRFVATRVERMARRWIPLDVAADGIRIKRAVAVSSLSGYAALSVQDERSAILLSAALGRQAERLSESHAGSVINSQPDMVMMSFAEPEDALKAVQQLHATFASALTDLGLKALRLHSAIHYGEIVQLNDGGILGQTVNIVSRMVHLARSGDIVVSDELVERLDAQARFQPLGSRRFRNLVRPIGCHRLVTDG